MFNNNTVNSLPVSRVGASVHVSCKSLSLQAKSETKWELWTREKDVTILVIIIWMAILEKETHRYNICTFFFYQWKFFVFNQYKQL